MLGLHGAGNQNEIDIDDAKQDASDINNGHQQRMTENVGIGRELVEPDDEHFATGRYLERSRVTLEHFALAVWEVSKLTYLQ